MPKPVTANAKAGRGGRQRVSLERNRGRKMGTTTSNSGQTRPTRRAAKSSANAAVAGTRFDGGGGASTAAMKGTRLSFGSAIDSSSSDGGGGGGGDTGIANTTVASPAYIGRRSAGPSSSAFLEHSGAVKNYGGLLLGRASGGGGGGRPSFSASLMRAAASRASTSNEMSDVDASAVVPAKRPRASDPFLGEVDKGEHNEEGGEEEAHARAFCRSHDDGATYHNDLDSNPLGMHMEKWSEEAENTNEESPLPIAKKPRLASPHHTPRPTRGSLGLSSLNINLTPTSQTLWRKKELNDNDPEELEEVAEEAPATVKKPSQTTRDFTPDATVQAILSQDPPTATREAQLRPGFAPPSPRTPLWAALEAHRRERDSSARDISNHNNHQHHNVEESNEEEEDLFAFDWSPLSAPRRPRGSRSQVTSLPQRLPQGSSQALLSPSQQQLAQNSILLVNGDDGDGERDMEEKEDDIPGTMVSSRGFRREHLLPNRNRLLPGSASASQGAVRTHSAQTAGVSRRGTHSVNRRRQASASIGPAARHRSVNLLDPEGLHDDEVEPLFVESASSQESFIGADSFAAMVSTVEGGGPRRERSEGGYGELDVAMSLTQEAARLEGVEQGHGVHLARPTQRARHDKPSKRKTSGSRNSPSGMGTASRAASKSTYEWVTASDLEGNSAIFPKSTQSAAAPVTTTPSDSASQPVSARTQRMLAWAKQARDFFRFIDQRPLATVSPVSRRRTLSGNQSGRAAPTGPLVGADPLSTRSLSRRQQPTPRANSTASDHNDNAGPLHSARRHGASARVVTAPSPRTPSTQQPQRRRRGRQGRPETPTEGASAGPSVSSARGSPSPRTAVTTVPGVYIGHAQPRSTSLHQQQATPSMPSTVPAATTVTGHSASDASSGSGGQSARGGGFAAMIARAKQKAADAAASARTSASHQR